MKRRDLLKLGIISALATAGGAGALRLYKRTAGIGRIIEYPDPILRQAAAPVDAIDDYIAELSRQMINTLRYHSLIGFFSEAYIGRGMAAPQIGVLKRMIVCGLYGEIRVLINPEIIEKQGGYSGYESCLSVPDHDRSIVRRPAYVKVIYTDLYDKRYQLAASKGYAALLAHEIDHLDGTLYIDRV